MICNNDVKKMLLLENEKSRELNPIKFMNKHDFINHYFFSYDYKTIYYVMKNYQVPYSIAKEYIHYLYVVEDKNYKSHKLCFLRDLKKDLEKNHLLYFSKPFQVSIQNKELSIKHIFDLDQYEEKAIGQVIEVDDVELDFPVYEFDTLEEEVGRVCVEIRKLMKKGIPLSKIFLCNVREDYYFILDKLFTYYGIPIEIPYKRSIYGTSFVQNYLKTREIDLEDTSIINKALCGVLGELSVLEDDSYKDEILIELLKNTYIPNKHYEEVVTITDIDSRPFMDDEYVFVFGFNQDSLPKIHKDIEYLSDQDREEVEMYSTTYLNHREKKVVAYLLSNIKNLFISYKLSSPFQKYYPSSMIGDYHLEVIRETLYDKEYSNLYNMIRLGEMMDTYYIYGEKNKNLDTYASKYDIPYLEYDHHFTGINTDTYLKNLSYPLRLSYTSLNTYNECGFKYYVQYVLRLGDYEDTFASIIGSLYHEVLSLYKKEGFNLDKCWDSYLEKKDLSLKDTVLLVRIRKDLEELLEVLKKQQAYTKFIDEVYEKELKVKVRDDVLVEFIGYVDKIMMYKRVSDTFFTIIDYKTGTIDTHIEPMKYGLHMQLPIYLYLIHNSKVFDSPIFTGIYYQNILFSYPAWSKDLEKNKKDNYKLKGYSTDNHELLELFDCTYRESELIKSMKYSDEKGFDRYSKVLSDQMVYKIIEYTDKIIHDTTNHIVEGDFVINPKVYSKENISCKWCKFKDMCYVGDSDLVYLDKVDDFSFLETVEI